MDSQLRQVRSWTEKIPDLTDKDPGSRKLKAMFKRFPNSKSRLIFPNTLMAGFATLIVMSFWINSMRLPSLTNRAESEQKTFVLQSEKKAFSASEIPSFFIKPAHATTLPKDTSVKMLSKRLMKEVDVGKTWKGGALAVKFPKMAKITPGAYETQVRAGEDVMDYDFVWGVLAVNTNKAIYEQNEEVYLQMAVLDSRDHTICDANVGVKIQLPNNKGEQFLNQQKVSPSEGETLTR